MKSLQLKIPPVLIAIIAAICMRVVKAAFPSFNIALPLRGTMASILSIAGGVISGLGILSFRHAKTSVNPMRFDSVSTLVTSGIYSITRNPMYLGLLFVLLGWLYFISSVISIVFIPAYILYMNYFQIGPEETVLESKFGTAFKQYKLKVRRWL
jgi:protein-S-isoprenylcysteine O-methyltransferase Ste14